MEKENKFRKLPQTILEDGILGCIFQDNDELINVINVVSPELFRYEPNNKIYKIACKFYENKIPIDKVTVWQEVVNNGWDNTFLTEKHVNGLQNGGGSMRSANAKYYAEALVYKYGSEGCPEGAYNAYLEIKDKQIHSPEEAMNIFVKQMLKMGDFGKKDSKFSTPTIDELDIFSDMQRKIETDAVKGLNFPLYDVSKALDGLVKQNVYTLIAHSSVGKTTLALQTALMNAKEGKNVLIASFEMSVEKLSMKLVCMETGLNSLAISNPKVYIQKLIDHKIVRNETEGFNWIKGKILTGKRAIENLPITIYNDASANIVKLKANIDKYILQEKRLDLLIIDSTDLMHNHDNQASELFTIYKKLKDYANEYDIPILALHQFSRANLMASKDYFPTVGAIKGSEGVFNNSDVVLFIYRPDVYDDLIREKPDLHGVVQIVFGKMRDGEKPRPIDVRFEKGMFKDLVEAIDLRRKVNIS